MTRYIKFESTFVMSFTYKILIKSVILSFTNHYHLPTFQGVDHALMRAKIWSKYAKDVMNFVEKRTSLEMEWAKNLTRLAQTMRPILKEESYLPFQSIYCTALDQDLEMCATTQVFLTFSTTYQKTF